LLFYVVYMCQKSLNFIVAFNCYKQAKMKGGIILVGPPCKLRWTAVSMNDNRADVSAISMTNQAV